MERSKQAFLFLCHSASRQVIKEYRSIRRAIAGMGKSFFVYHNRSTEIPPSLLGDELYLFSNESLSKLNYPRIGPSFLPGHVGFVLMQFSRDNPGFDYYWRIEYDVRFSGDWHFFFEALHDREHDFLTCHIRYHADEPDWPWWSLHHPIKSIPFSERLRSFNPICRLSNASLSLLHQSLSDGWCGHEEVLWPTLLYHNSFTILDIGGKGRFTPQGMKDMFYTESKPNTAGTLETGTMRYRPSFWRVGHERNKLYHPIKPTFFVMREKLRHRRWRLPRRLGRRIWDAFLPRP